MVSPENLIDLIYQSATDDTKFIDIIEHFARSFDTPSCIYLLHASSASPQNIITTNIAGPDWEKYTSHFYEKDPCVGKQNRAPLDRVFSNLEFFGGENPERNEHVNDFLRPYFGGRLVQAILIDRIGDQSSLLVTGVRETHESHLACKVSSLLEYVRPHMQRSARLRRLRRSEPAEYDIPFSRIDRPVIAFNSSGRIIYSNIHFDYEANNLKSIVEFEISSNCVSIKRDSEIFRMSRELADGDENLKLCFLMDDFGLPVRVTLSLFGENKFASVFETLPRRKSRIEIAFIEMYNLSKAEVILCEQLIIGLTAYEAANRLNKSNSTIRNQLASIFNKTGVRSQQELMYVLRVADRRD